MSFVTGDEYIQSSDQLTTTIISKYREAHKAGVAAALAGRSDIPPYSDVNLSKLWLAGYDSVVITEES